jgi:hypothetical protein
MAFRVSIKCLILSSVSAEDGFAGLKREILQHAKLCEARKAATASDTHQKKESFTYGGGALVEETLGFSNQLVA